MEKNNKNPFEKMFMTDGKFHYQDIQTSPGKHIQFNLEVFLRRKASLQLKYNSDSAFRQRGF